MKASSSAKSTKTDTDSDTGASSTVDVQTSANATTDVETNTDVATDQLPKVHSTRAQDEVKAKISVLRSEIVTAKKKLDSGLAADPPQLRRTMRIKENELAEQKKLKKLQGNVQRQAKSRLKRKAELIPHRWNTNEGKRHVNTVLVKLLKARNDEHRAHQDSKFAAATVKYVHQLAAALGPSEVLFISQDDKARVPIGITAANKQAPLLMSLEYKVTLPDHDWVIAQKHKLIPSVYAVCQIKPNMIGQENAVTYSGPTYITIRSGKHDTNSAYSHGLDFNQMIELDEMKNAVKTVDGIVKPVLIFSTDGGPDENPHYPKVLKVAAHHFKNHNLDAVFCVTNAPGRSAFNPVERRMAPLSHDLAGLILPHDHYGSHLNAAGKTIDPDLEIKNFAMAGQTLAEIWSKTVIDSNPVIAVYVPPEDTEDMWDELSETWKEKHLLQSQYFLQITKCDDQSCCRPYRSSIRAILPGRFIPSPVPVKQTRNGLVAPEPDETLIDSHYGSLFSRIALSAILPQCAKKFKIFPFDLYCLSLIGKLQPRICPVCGMYFPSQKAKSSHTKLHTGAKFVEVSKRYEEALDTITSSVQKDLAIPVDSLLIQSRNEPQYHGSKKTNYYDVEKQTSCSSGTLIPLRQ
ncbi:hypothetical protein EB796_023278 [Bugula neritina]|uniref:C2H2-type domain-containing protein n=1 Tax=Bugula neritina TaxID=10212 RepID=A0A7J7IWX5_BUGNE|nr:hypothetical protein EB796_023278 [Bugula neritina]